MAQLQVLRHEKREPPSGSEHTRMHTAHGSRPNVEHHTFCMRTAQNYAISENDTLETTILTSTNTTGTLTRDDLDQPGTTYITYPVLLASPCPLSPSSHACGSNSGSSSAPPRCLGSSPAPCKALCPLEQNGCGREGTPC